MKGFLLEYSLSLPPLVLVFEFNPQTLSRTRSIQLPSSEVPGFRGYDFNLPTETPRVAQGVSINAEEFSLDILLDATDRMNDGNVIASTLGIEPELDTLRSMVEPKTQGPAGLQVLASLGHGGTRAFQRDVHASVILLVWGTHVLPVFLTSVQIEEKAHLPSLIPYRANASLSFQVIEGNNPFYKVETIRQAIGAGINLASTISGSFSASF
ncbi:MAG: hypothetical protein ACSHX0_07825 [Akkermansiaceae bacterium]